MKPVRISIFIRLLLSFVIGGFLINGALFDALRGPPTKSPDQLRQPDSPSQSRPSLGPGGLSQPPSPQLLKEKADAIFSQLGDHPTLKKARKIKGDSELEISFVGSEKSWSTAENLPPWEHLMEQGVRFVTDPTIVAGPGFMFKELAVGKIILFFSGSWLYNPFKDPKYISMILFRVSLIVLLCYLFVVWQLRPIKWLKKGAVAVGEGKLDFKVPVKHSSEFGELASTFNEMTSRLDKMIKAREELMANISHELRSPLTRIKLAVELSDDDKQKDQLNEDINEMEKMIEEMLESYRLDSEHGGIKLEEVNFREFIENISKKFDTRKPGVTTKSLPHDVTAQIDTERIRTVLINLIENALKYSSPSAPPVEISYEKYDKNIRVDIKDFGTGIPEDQLEYIFEPFYRVDKSRRRDTGGAGLGLNLCQKIMAAHKGSISVANNASDGSTFTLNIPS